MAHVISFMEVKMAPASVLKVMSALFLSFVDSSFLQIVASVVRLLQVRRPVMAECMSVIS